MDPLTGRGCGQQPQGMRPTATAFAPAALVAPAGLLHLLPVWAVLVVVGVGLVLTVVQGIVTQGIRLRAISRITSSCDALRVLEIEDPPASARTVDHPSPAPPTQRAAAARRRQRCRL